MKDCHVEAKMTLKKKISLEGRIETDGQKLQGEKEKTTTKWERYLQFT